MNPQTQQKIEEQNRDTRALERAMCLWTKGLAGPLEAELCMNYIRKTYGTRSAVREDKNGAADPVAMAIAIGAQNVYLDIMKRAENGAVVK